jgi:hypothetical protein
LKAALAASVFALAGLLLWFLSPLISNTTADKTRPSAQSGPSADYFRVGGISDSSVFVFDMNPNVHIGNDGLVFELNSRTPNGGATVDFTDRSGLLDPFFTKSAIAFELQACGGEGPPAGDVRVEARAPDQRRPTLFVLNRATPSTGPDALRYLWRPLRITVTWETGGAPVQPDCAVLVAPIDTPRAFAAARQP